MDLLVKDNAERVRCRVVRKFVDLISIFGLTGCGK